MFQLEGQSTEGVDKELAELRKQKRSKERLGNAYDLQNHYRSFVFRVFLFSFSEQENRKMSMHRTSERKSTERNRYTDSSDDDFRAPVPSRKQTKTPGKNHGLFHNNYA